MAHVFPVMMAYDESLSKEELEAGFKELLSTVKTAQITYAVRDSMVENIEIKEGDIMQLVEDKVVAVSNDIEEGIIGAIEKIVDEDTEVITLYAGEDISDDALDQVVSKLEEKIFRLRYYFISWRTADLLLCCISRITYKNKIYIKKHSVLVKHCAFIIKLMT